MFWLGLGRKPTWLGSGLKNIFLFCRHKHSRRCLNNLVKKYQVVSQTFTNVETLSQTVVTWLSESESEVIYM